MASTIDVSFIEQYNAMLHVRYENQGFLYRGMTREGTVVGTKCYWQRFGGFTATDKSRNGQVELQDPTHTRVEATMVDKYVGSIVDDLDLMKQNVDEMRAHAHGQMTALGREFDAGIRTTMAAGADSDIGPGDGTTLALTHMNAVGEKLILENAPMDGRCYAAVGARTWSKMLTIPEFVNLDYVGPDQLPYAGGMTAKRWRGILWWVDPLIAYNDTTKVETNLIWHQDAVGHGTNKQPSTDIGWERLHQAHAFVSSMSQGSAVIEPKGVYTWSVDVLA